MKKSNVLWIILLLLVLWAVPSMAEEEWLWRTEGDLAFLTAYQGTETEIVIPQKVDEISVYGIDAGTIPASASAVTIPTAVGRIEDNAISPNTVVKAYHGAYALQWAADSGLRSEDLSTPGFSSLVVDLTGSSYQKAEDGYLLDPALGRALRAGVALYIPETGKAWGVNELKERDGKYLAVVEEADVLLTYNRVKFTNQRLASRGVSLDSNGVATVSFATDSSYRINLNPTANIGVGISPFMEIRNLDVNIEVDSVALQLAAIEAMNPVVGKTILAWNMVALVNKMPELSLDTTRFIQKCYVHGTYDVGVSASLTSTTAVGEFELNGVRIPLGSTGFQLQPFAMLQVTFPHESHSEFGYENMQFTLDYDNRNGQKSLDGGISQGTPYFRASLMDSFSASVNVGIALDFMPCFTVGEIVQSLSFTSEATTSRENIDIYRGTEKCRDISWEVMRKIQLTINPGIDFRTFSTKFFKVNTYAQMEHEIADDLYLGATLGTNTSIYLTKEINKQLIYWPWTIGNITLDSGATAHFEQSADGSWKMYDSCQRMHALHYNPEVKGIEPFDIDCSELNGKYDWNTKNFQLNYPGKSFEGWYTDDGELFFDQLEDKYAPEEWSGTINLTAHWKDADSNVYGGKWDRYHGRYLNRFGNDPKEEFIYEMRGGLTTELYIVDPDGVEREYYWYDIANMEDAVGQIYHDYLTMDAVPLQQKYKNLGGYCFFVTFDPTAEGNHRKVAGYGSNRAIVSGYDSANLYNLVFHPLVYRCYGFGNCPNLKTVTGNNHLYELGIFTSCPSLEKVTGINGITELEDYAFANCYSLWDITLPDTLETIGAYAFANCSSMKQIILPVYLKSINAGAFLNSGLTWFVTPESVKKIGGSAFKNCVDLTTVKLSAVNRIEDYAFANTANLETVEISGDQVYVSGKAFENSGVREITISAETLDTFSPSSVENLEKLTINAENAGIISLYSLPGLKELTICVDGEISSLNIDHCPQLETINLKASGIGDLRIQYCQRLSSLNVENNEKCEKVYVAYCDQMEALIIPGWITEATVSYCQNLKMLALGSTYGDKYVHKLSISNLNALERIEIADRSSDPDTPGTVYISSCINLREVSLSLSEDADKITISYSCPYAQITLRPASADGEATTLMHFDGSYGMEYADILLIPGSEFKLLRPTRAKYGSYWRTFLGWVLNGDDSRLLQEGDTIIVPDTESTLYAMYEKNYYSVDIRDGIFYSYERFYYDGDGTLIIPEEVVQLADSCVDANEIIVYIGKNVSSIDPKAFVTAASLQRIEVDQANPHYMSVDGILYSRGGTLVSVPACTLLTEYEIPDTTKEIGSYAFYGSSYANLTSVVIPDSVTSVGEEWYSGIRGCVIYGSTEGPVADSAREVGLYYNYFPVYFISENACVAVSVAQAGTELPELRNLKDDGTFLGWSQAEKGTPLKGPITVPYGGMTLYAQWCTTPAPATEFVLPSSLTVIEEEAFAGMNMRSVRVPSAVTSVESRAFADCKRLEILVFDSLNTSIADDALENVSNDLVIYGFSNSEAESFSREHGIEFINLDN